MITKKIQTIAYYTFKQILKSKILYVTIGLGLAMMLVTFVATEFTYGVPEKVALDFGLGMLSLSSMAISLFMGVTLLPSEIDSRTVYMVISRPVPRYAFITGKIVGLFAVLLVNVTILSLMTLICTTLLGGSIDQVTILTVVFNILECLLLLLVVVFFSLFTNTILASVISLVILLLGHAVKETQDISFAVNRALFREVLNVYHLILPAFYKLNLKDFVLYKVSLTPQFLAGSFLYGVLYSGFLFFLILFIFNRKNLD